MCVCCEELQVLLSLAVCQSLVAHNDVSRASYLDIIEHTTIVRTNHHLGRIKLLGLSLSLRFLLKDTTLSYFEDEIHVEIPGQPVAFASEQCQTASTLYLAKYTVRIVKTCDHAYTYRYSTSIHRRVNADTFRLSGT